MPQTYNQLKGDFEHSLLMQNNLTLAYTVFLKKFEIKVKFVTTTDPEGFREAIDEKTKAIYVETIGNPKYIAADLPAISKIAHDNGVPVIVDNTFGMGGKCWNLSNVSLSDSPGRISLPAI